MPDAEGKSLIWGSRFSQGPHPLFFAYGRSVDWDRRLAPQDIRGSIAHVHSLQAAGVLEPNVSGQTLRSAVTYPRRPRALRWAAPDPSAAGA